MTALDWPNRQGVFIAIVVDVIACSVFLAISSVGQDLKRLAAAGSEHTRERPSAENASHHSLLSFKEGRLVDEEGVVDELAVEGLIAIHRVQIEGVVRSIFAARLHDRSSSQGLGIGE